MKANIEDRVKNRVPAKVVGTIEFYGKTLDVYESLEDPIFFIGDLATILDYSEGNQNHLADLCESYQKLTVPLLLAGQIRHALFVTEAGLYTILAQSRKPLARIWREIITRELIFLRKNRGYNVAQQFAEWNELADDIYFDDETGKFMVTVTVAGGDTDQIPLDDYPEWDRERQRKFERMQRGRSEG